MQNLQCPLQALLVPTESSGYLAESLKRKNIKVLVLDSR